MVVYWKIFDLFIIEGERMGINRRDLEAKLLVLTSQYYSFTVKIYWDLF